MKSSSSLSVQSSFNPRAHVGRDTTLFAPCSAASVSIHAPTWGATALAPFSAAGNLFQSTRPRGARPLACYRLIAKSGFNPRAHVGRDPKATAAKTTAQVSIHAPTWGATYPNSEPLPGYPFQSTRPRGARPKARKPGSPESPVSIHAPTWGATIPYDVLRLLKSCFNPRAHVGRDLPEQRTFAGLPVSIHAPTWGATRGYNLPANEPQFQSTRPRGARLLSSKRS